MVVGLLMVVCVAVVHGHNSSSLDWLFPPSSSHLGLLSPAPLASPAPRPQQVPVRPPAPPERWADANVSWGVAVRSLAPPACHQRTSISRVFRYVNTALACVVMVVGVMGNGTLLRIIHQNKSMRTGPNALIASLALGDLLYVVLGTPLTLYKLLAMRWPFSDHPAGLFLCKAFPFLQKASVGITVLNLCVLSIDRYRAVASWSRVRGVGVPMVTAVEIVMVWLLAALLAVPEALAFNMVTFTHHNVTMTTCMLQTSSPFTALYIRLKDWWLLGAYFCVPLVCSGVFYSLMTREMLQHRAALKHMLADQLRQRREVAKAVFSLVLIFAVCWSPLHLSRLLRNTWYRSHDPHRCSLLSFLLVMDYLSINMATINSCINPIILFCVSKKFKNCFKSCLCCWLHPGSPSSSLLHHHGNSLQYKHSDH